MLFGGLEWWCCFGIGLIWCLLDYYVGVFVLGCLFLYCGCIVVLLFDCFRVHSIPDLNWFFYLLGGWVLVFGVLGFVLRLFANLLIVVLAVVGCFELVLGG